MFGLKEYFDSRNFKISSAYMEAVLSKLLISAEC